MTRKQGFSLVELVVVILLIGILSAVAVPRLFSSTNKAHQAAVQGLASQMSSTLKVMASESLLKGSAGVDAIDGSSYAITQYGYPDFTVRVGTVLPNTSTDNGLGTSAGCLCFLVKIMGISEQLIGTADAIGENLPANEDKNWVAILTGDGTSSGACTFEYTAKGSRGASIVYAPSLRQAVHVFTPQTW